MKKNLLLLICTLFLNIKVLQAQTQQRNVLISSAGANLASLGINTSTLKSASINLKPRIGYFVVDNLALGIDTNFFLSIYRGNASTSVYLGPFVRLYFPKEKVYPFIEASGLYGTDKAIVLGGGAGLGYPLGEKVSVDLTARFNSYTDLENSYNSQSTTTLIMIGLGFSIYL
jgi:hypothetical protein